MLKTPTHELLSFVNLITSISMIMYSLYNKNKYPTVIRIHGDKAIVENYLGREITIPNHKYQIGDTYDGGVDFIMSSDIMPTYSPFNEGSF